MSSSFFCLHQQQIFFLIRVFLCNARTQILPLKFVFRLYFPSEPPSSTNPLQPARFFYMDVLISFYVLAGRKLKAPVT